MLDQYSNSEMPYDYEPRPREREEERGLRREIQLTGVQANADLNLDVGHVPHLKGPNAMQDVKGHVGHLGCMSVTIAVGDP